MSWSFPSLSLSPPSLFPDKKIPALEFLDLIPSFRSKFGNSKLQTLVLGAYKKVFTIIELWGQLKNMLILLFIST
jgi:hypothetical protein